MLATAVMADEAVLMLFMHRPKISRAVQRPKISLAVLIIQMTIVPATEAVLI